MNQVSTSELLTMAYGAIDNGAKKIELENDECEVTAYQMGMPG